MSRARGLRGLALAALLVLLGPLGVRAGQTCEAGPPSRDDLEGAVGLARQTAERLEASGARVLLLARAGQDLRAHGLRWSHMGWAYRLPDEGEAPVWRVAHKLNRCGTARGDVFRQGLAEFFLDRPWRLEAAFVVPSAEVQARLAPLLQDDARLLAWHGVPYSLLAYPWSTRYQQSNQWALETLAGAMDESAHDRERAQAWLRLHGLQPGVVRLGPLTRLGARLTRANVAFDDHPEARRLAGRLETSTVDAAFEWLRHEGLAGPVHTVP